MLITKPPQKTVICEICEDFVLNPLTMGMESNRECSLLIQLCRACGTVDLELMQLCREVTIGCAAN